MRLFHAHDAFFDAAGMLEDFRFHDVQLDQRRRVIDSFVDEIESPLVVVEEVEMLRKVVPDLVMQTTIIQYCMMRTFRSSDLPIES